MKSSRIPAPSDPLYKVVVLCLLYAGFNVPGDGQLPAMTGSCPPRLAHHVPPSVRLSETNINSVCNCRKQRGRMKICSHSLIFDPLNFSHPVIKVRAHVNKIC